MSKRLTDGEWLEYERLRALNAEMLTALKAVMNARILKEHMHLVPVVEALINRAIAKAEEAKMDGENEPEAVEKVVRLAFDEIASEDHAEGLLMTYKPQIRRIAKRVAEMLRSPKMLPEEIRRELAAELAYDEDKMFHGSR